MTYNVHFATFRELDTITADAVTDASESTHKGVNQRSKDVPHDNIKDPSRLLELSPGMRVNTGYVNFTRVTSSKHLII